MRIAFVHYPGRIARLDDARAGRAPTEFLFGAVELERRGIDVAHFEIDPNRRPGVPGAVFDRLTYRGYLPPHVTSTTLRQAHGLLGALSRFDAIVATTAGTALSLAAWARVRRPPPLLGIVTGLTDRAHRRTRRMIVARLLRELHAMLYGEAELPSMLALDRRLAGRVHVNQFGVDSRFWTQSSEPEDDYVLAIGNDGRRDYETLVRAAPQIPTAVRIFTNHPRPASLPRNVTWELADWHRQVLTDVEVRSLYRGARAVVVPLRESIQPSGQSVTLQAMACGKPVVLTETDGLWSRAAIRDGENVLLVPSGDPATLARRVAELLDSPGLGSSLGARARSSVLEIATVDLFADRMLSLCRSAVEADGDLRRHG